MNLIKLWLDLGMLHLLIVRLHTIMMLDIGANTTVNLLLLAAINIIDNNILWRITHIGVMMRNLPKVLYVHYVLILDHAHVTSLWTDATWD